MSDSQRPVRTRFAPSPTGFLHVGGVRTALFAFLLARKHGGQFLLRVEDTDRERLVPEAVKGIVEDLAWVGITVDEGPSHAELREAGYDVPDTPDLGGPCGPYIQSLRKPHYKEIAERLVREGHAYRCDCSPDRLDQERQAQMARHEPPGYSGYCRDRNVSEAAPHVIRLRIPADTVFEMEDVVMGHISWQSLALRDPVLLKSDGLPTYHLAVVVDDHYMNVSHVLRGTEWIPSAPIHLQLYKALGWTPPLFAHLPTVLGEDGKKLSKRHGATSLTAFKEAGYLPAAVVNFLALIGWSPGEGCEQEIFSMDELTERFSLDHVNSAGGMFAYPKLQWMNGMYIRALGADDLLERLLPICKNAGLNADRETLAKMIPLIQERLTLLTDAPSQLRFVFEDVIEQDLPAMFQKNIGAAEAIRILEGAQEAIRTVETFDKTSLDAALRAVAKTLGFPFGAVFLTVRIAVTGQKATPPLLESMEVIGREVSVRRIDQALVGLRAL